MTTKKKTTKPARTARPKTAKLKKERKPGALEMAAKVLAGAKEPMTTKELVDAMAEKGLWKSPGGKTPERTLYSAILREMATKGKEARFKKAERGKFTFVK